MAQDEDKIGSITHRSSAQRQRNWDQWEQYLAACDNDLKDYDKDIFNTPYMQLMSIIGAHMVSQFAREYGQARSILIQDHQIKALVDAHKPSLAVIGLFVTQIALNILGMGLSCAPYALAKTGEAAKALHGLSGGALGLGQGAASGSSLLQAENQGEIAALNYALEADKMQQSDHQNESHLQQQRAQRLAEEQRNNEQKRHESVKAVANNG